MRLLVPTSRRPEERGAALMLAILVLGVLVLIVLQITLGSSVDMRVAQNDIELTNFDAAIESAMLKTMQDLADDASAGADAGAGQAAAPDPSAAFGAPSAGGDGGETGPTDSHRDDWGRPQQTEINGVSLRILVQDEDSKYNVLTMLTEDEDEAEEAFNRVVRILDLCRDGTLSDIDEADARDMAEGMRDFMRDRRDAVLPRPALLTDRDDERDFGLPLTLREFVVLPGFNEFMFRDYRDAEGTVVHSIASFLTVSTSVSTYQDYRKALEDEVQGGALPPADGPAPGSSGSTTSSTSSTSSSGPGVRSTAGSSDGSSLGEGTATSTSSNGTPGVAVNINTAPNAVLHGLFDRGELSWEFLDALVRYRNEEDEEASDPDAEPVYDEYGEEVVTKQIFESSEELAEVDGWDLIEPDVRDKFNRLATVESQVFSIFITARASLTGEEGDSFGMTRAEAEEAKEKGTDRVRTVRAIVWRYQDGEEFKVIPLENWEVLDYVPFEVLDFPEEDR